MKKIIITTVFLFTILFVKAQVTNANVDLPNPCVALKVIENQFLIDFAIYPNPSDGFVNVEINTTINLLNAKIRVYDIRGVFIYESVIETDERYFKKSFFIPNISSGIYILSIVSNEKSISEKLIITK